ncbi:hypothetical protein EON79_23500 [bacterium]|nr:MAG: hypothetical protein EON79_23500 [bacterium]
MEVREMEFGAFLPQGRLTKAETHLARRRLFFRAAGMAALALLGFAFSAYLTAEWEKPGIERYLSLLPSLTILLFAVGSFLSEWRRSYVRFPAGADRGFLVGRKGFGEALVDGDRFAPIEGEWTSWEDLGAFQAPATVVRRDWSEIAIPHPLVPILKREMEARKA